MTTRSHPFRTPLRAALAALLALPLAACLGGCATAPGMSAAAPGRPYVLVTLKRGPRAAEKSDAERQTIQAAHLANIQRLAREGTLLVAGPYGTDNHDPTSRGIFLFDVPTVDEARRLTDTDPAVAAGVLAMELETFRSDADFRAAVVAELARNDAERAKGLTPSPGDHIRSYVIVRSPDPAAVEAALGRAAPQAVVFSGITGDGRGLIVLDAKDTATARAWLGATAASASADEWYATDLLREVLVGGRRPARTEAGR